MKERGINSTFKKIIYESTEMVFLADDAFPYNIFYSNEIFDQQIGQFLEDKSLVGLGLDINSYIFKEELILTYNEKEFSFNLELPQQNGSNYFLFYKGKEIKGPGLPPRKEAQLFFKNSIDLLAIGQENFLSWISDSVNILLGYKPEEVTNLDLCQFFHPDDVAVAKEFLFEIKQGIKSSQFLARLISKSGNYKWIDWNIHFMDTKFYAIGRDVSDFHEERLSIEKKNVLYKLTESLTSTGVWDFHSEKEQIGVSPEFQRILEIEEKSELPLNQFFSYFLPEFQLKLKNSFDKLLELGMGFDLKLKIKTSKNNEKWVRILGKHDPKNSSSIKTYGILQDIEEQSYGELGLYKEFYDQSPDSIVVLDINGNIIFTNRVANSFLGAPLDKEQEYHVSDFDKSFLSKRDWKKHVELLIADKSKIYLRDIKDINGNVISLEVNSKLIEVDGRSFIISISRDVSEKVSKEKSLQASSELLLNMTEQVPGALYQFVLDNEGQMNFSYLSAGIKDLLGLNEEEFSKIGDISMAISRVHPEDMPQVLTSSVVSARKLSPWTCQFRVKNPGNGGYKWIMGAAQPKLLDSGHVVWYGYLADISEQKIFEDSLKNAKETAERANQLKSDFLSMISHDLRTPLNAISGSVYSLLQDDHSSTQATALNTINFAVENLIIMINDLLDFQKIEAGKLTLEKNPMVLKEVLDQVIGGLEFHAKESQNILALKTKDNLDIRVLADKVRISQVLNNLITNALKFTSKGNVDLVVQIIDNSENRLKLYFEVKDTGVGIPKEYQSKLFNDFEQIQFSFNKKYGGTGLGLSITKKLLARMGSTIDFQSEPGIGTSFFFELELDKFKGEIIPTVSKPVSGDLDISNLKILMAEDNDVNALVLGKIIKKWGFNFDRVSNGEEAVEAVKNSTYDCVLMDIQMPIMDGFAATEKIRDFSSVPVLALSAATKLEVMEKIEALGFNGFVAKPIDAGELLKRIKEVLSSKGHKA